MKCHVFPVLYETKFFDVYFASTTIAKGWLRVVVLYVLYFYFVCRYQVTPRESLKAKTWETTHHHTIPIFNSQSLTTPLTNGHARCSHNITQLLRGLPLSHIARGKIPNIWSQCLACKGHHASNMLLKKMLA